MAGVGSLLSVFIATFSNFEKRGGILNSLVALEIYSLIYYSAEAVFKKLFFESVCGEIEYESK